MNMLQQIFSEQFVYALGWMLIHSLWQGALIGIIIALLIIFMYRYTARLRYFIYTLSLFLFAGIAVLTFFRSYFMFEEGVSGPANDVPVAVAPAGVLSAQPLMAGDTSYLADFFDRLLLYFQANIPVFVAIWLLGMLAMLLRFMGGYALVRRYRRYRVKAVMGSWGQRFKKLAEKIGVNPKVKLLESALVKVPMAIGYLKPVVLLPLGALNGVPAKQMEAILVHELAHIRRKDYVMNLMQSVIEAVFFYHPVVWWLSGNIRVERENICDDIAITITGNTMEFAKALTNIQGISLGVPGLAAGLSGKNKNRLLNRVRRLTGKPKLQSGFTEGFIAASILVVSLIGLSAAAMITYPADKAVDPLLTFHEPAMETSGFQKLDGIVILPDTVLKKEQAARTAKAAKERVVVVNSEKELSEEQKQELMEARAKLEAEMHNMEAEIRAMEAELMKDHELEKHKKNYERYYKDHQQFTEQWEQAAEAYRDAVRNAHYPAAYTNWSVPKMVYSKDSVLIYGDDTLSWSFRAPDYKVFIPDSIEMYFDTWSDHFEDLEDVYFDMEEHEHALQEKLQELREMDHLDAIYDHRDFYVEPPRANFSPDVFMHEGFVYSPMARRIVEDELRDDGLIEYGREYLVVVGKKQMLINGEKQSRSVHKKYRRIVESAKESWLMDEDDDFKVHIGH